MSNPIDELFRQKLEGHQIAPSADAWERLTAQRDAKKGIAVKKWMSIAASLTLIIITIYSINDDSGKLDDTRKIVNLTQPVKIEPSEEVVMPIAEKEVESVEPQQVAKHTTPEEPAKKDYKAAVTTNNVAKVVHKELPERVTKKGLETDLEIEISQIQFEKIEIAAIKTSNLPTEKHSTFFDKIADTAKEIKNSDGMMAELRGIKDEMLSLELFKTKKSI